MILLHLFITMLLWQTRHWSSNTKYLINSKSTETLADQVVTRLYTQNDINIIKIKEKKEKEKTVTGSAWSLFAVSAIYEGYKHQSKTTVEQIGLPRIDHNWDLDTCAGKLWSMPYPWKSWLLFQRGFASSFRVPFLKNHLTVPEGWKGLKDWQKVKKTSSTCDEKR